MSTIKLGVDVPEGSRLTLSTSAGVVEFVEGVATVTKGQEEELRDTHGLDFTVLKGKAATRAAAGPDQTLSEMLQDNPPGEQQPALTREVDPKTMSEVDKAHEGIPNKAAGSIQPEAQGYDEPPKQGRKRG